MNSHSGHRERQGGFTVSEVVLAIGVVAFGLVAVLGVLPAGLSVVKDNREETIIRYEARYWINALRAGMQQFDALDQVEWVEIQLWDSTLDPDNDDPSEVYRVHRTRLGADGGGYLPSSGLDTGDTNSFSMGAVKQSSWPQDVIGWLSIPNRLKDGRWVKKTALVRPLNSTLFDRINGRKLLVAKKTDKAGKAGKAGKADGDFVYHPIPGGDLAFSYLLEVEVKPDTSPSLYEVNLTFKWPVLDDPTQKDDPGRSPASPWASKNTSTNVTFVSKMKFKSLGMVERAICKDKLILMQTTPERVEAAKAILDVIGAEVPGFEVTIDELLSQSPLIVEFSHIQDVLKDLTLVVPDFKKVMKKIPVPISEVERWRLIQRPYEGQGLYSMRQVFPGPAGSTLENGGYEPKLIRWGHLGRFSWLLDPFRNERFQGFKPAANYFDQLYFLTPDNQ